jgi:hypothetical protein
MVFATSGSTNKHLGGPLKEVEVTGVDTLKKNGELLLVAVFNARAQAPYDGNTLGTWLHLSLTGATPSLIPELKKANLASAAIYYGESICSAGAANACLWTGIPISNYNSTLNVQPAQLTRNGSTLSLANPITATIDGNCYTQTTPAVRIKSDVKIDLSVEFDPDGRRISKATYSYERIDRSPGKAKYIYSFTFTDLKLRNNAPSIWPDQQKSYIFEYPGAYDSPGTTGSHVPQKEGLQTTCDGTVTSRWADVNWNAPPYPSKLWVMLDPDTWHRSY